MLALRAAACVGDGRSDAHGVRETAHSLLNLSKAWTVRSTPNTLTRWADVCTYDTHTCAYTLPPHGPLASSSPCAYLVELGGELFALLRLRCGELIAQSVECALQLRHRAMSRGVLGKSSVRARALTAASLSAAPFCSSAVATAPRNALSSSRSCAQGHRYEGCGLVQSPVVPPYLRKLGDHANAAAAVRSRAEGTRVRWPARTRAAQLASPGGAPGLLAGDRVELGDQRATRARSVRRVRSADRRCLRPGRRGGAQRARQLRLACLELRASVRLLSSPDRRRTHLTQLLHEQGLVSASGGSGGAARAQHHQSARSRSAAARRTCRPALTARPARRWRRRRGPPGGSGGRFPGAWPGSCATPAPPPRS